MSHDERHVRFPVSCPICRNEVLAEYRRTDVMGALVNDRPIQLHAPCCNASWTAGYIEMQQIRTHMGVARLDNAGRISPAEKRNLSDD